MLDKVSLNKKIQNFMDANPSVKGMSEAELISCLVENEIVTLDELQELSVFASNQDYEVYGLTLQNTKTINDVIQKGKNSEILFKSNDGNTYNLNTIIQNKINKLSQELQKAEDSNGWIGMAWSWAKNVTGLGASFNKVRDKQSHEQDLLKQLTMDNPKKAEIFKELTGVDFTPETLEAFKEELPLESEKALEGYKEGQEMVTDITGDFVSGIAAFSFYTAAIAAAPFTGGASIAVGIAAAAASGAVIKSGIKALDCVGNNKEYTTNDLLYDLGTGAVSGLLAPVSAGAGGAIGKTIATKCGMQVLKSAGKGVTEEVVTTGLKQTLKHSMLNPGSYKYAGGTLLQKTGVYGAEIAVDAGGSGALDGAFRAGVNGDDVIEGATTGLFAGIFMGGAFKGIGGGWRKIKKAVKEEPSVKVHENDQINHILEPDQGIPYNKSILNSNEIKNNALSEAVDYNAKKYIENIYQQFHNNPEMLQRTLNECRSNGTLDVNKLKRYSELIEEINHIDDNSSSVVIGIDGWIEGINIRDDMRTHILSNTNLLDNDLKIKDLDAQLLSKNKNQLSNNSKYFDLGSPKLNKKTHKYVYIFENLRDAADFNGLRGKTPLSGNIGGIKFRLKKLKEQGIETIIDFRSIGECSDNAIKAMEEIGIKYINIPIEDCNWNIQSVRQLGSYIETVNKGNFYAGCANGQARTDIGIAINYIFNPHSNNIPSLYYGSKSSTRLSVEKNIKQILNVIQENPNIIEEWGWSDYNTFIEIINIRITNLKNSIH